VLKIQVSHLFVLQWLPQKQATQKFLIFKFLFNHKNCLEGVLVMSKYTSDVDDFIACHATT